MNLINRKTNFESASKTDIKPIRKKKTDKADIHEKFYQNSKKSCIRCRKEKKQKGTLNKLPQNTKKLIHELKNMKVSVLRDKTKAKEQN